MAHIDVMRDTVILAETVGANLFVGVDGLLGGNYGVTQFGGASGEAAEVITLGVADVVVGTDDVVAGDMVVADTDGTALKKNSTTETTTVPDAGGDVVVTVDHKVKYFVVKKGAVSGGLAEILVR
ncbi:MAG: hypothetical protein A2Y41_00400 [Spirochaetes bacterium GWB1_36_13]|nr:MAG: hypothetical protein A2Y41_00400 [Spirochaetes bacterium GWB1_36_13]